MFFSPLFHMIHSMDKYFINPYDYDYSEVYDIIGIDENYSIREIVSGGARGADKLGEQFAKNYNLSLKVYEADWQKYGRRAGFVRNVDIIKYCDICFAFWDGESHGTKHDIELCEQYGKPCYICYYKNNEEDNGGNI